MSFIQSLPKYLFALIIAMFIQGSAKANEKIKPESVVSKKTKLVSLEVYKNASCGCCGLWIQHIKNNGIKVVTHNANDLRVFKADKGINPRYQSCHTAISQDGYVFEGHIPAKLIKQFLQEKPKDAIGLAAPGMPMGSPGMEMGDKFYAYDVLLLKADGSSEVFAQINSKEEQY